MNADAGSYEAVWSTELAVGLGRHVIADDLRTWVDSGLMTLFFLVVGLKTRREFDLGDLRDRSRFVLPLAAGLVGMLVPVPRRPGRDRAGLQRAAYAAPVTLGVLLAYVVGKPVAVVGTSWLVTRASGGRVRPPVGTAAVAASGTIAGVGFTVALLVASRAFTGAELAQAKLGALTAAVLAAVLTWVVLRVTARLPPVRRTRALLGDPRLIQDLVPAVDVERDHVRGSYRAAITIIEFGDFECPHCGRAEPVVRELLTDTTIRYVWRHLPLVDVHPRAQLAAEAAEAAAEQGAFWAMRDRLLDSPDALTPADLVGHAERLGLDADRVRTALDEGTYATRIARDVESADLSGVSGTPTFFINGQRHHGPYDLASLTAAIDTERQRLAAAPGR